ncbi:hypothetical protein GCM10011529_24260 [Polymorphobacter glacialis]|uniref:Uncharacterized protein n=2 Tax=Sandarakinorhabdus glacialis TaxID=1614636 RepID=A0A916ZWE5_9SPHN|nr:hypothetical protein GCM10011529_24260 [Polymorphobacter glacialis]
MEVCIIFDMAFHAQAAGAVWIVKSAKNRRWFDKQSDLDAGSAVFTPEGGEALGAILRSIWNVQEHYPDWSQIIVTGVATTKELTDELLVEGSVMVTERGFTLVRT